MPEEVGSEKRTKIYSEMKNQFYDQVIGAPDVSEALLDNKNSNVYKDLIEGMIRAKFEHGDVRVKHPKAFTDQTMRDFDIDNVRGLINPVVNEIVDEKSLTKEGEERFRSKVKNIINLVSFDQR